MSYVVPDKFAMSREDAVFVAKKYLKESIYRSAFLEGIAVTFPQTEEILDGAVVNNVPARDISKVFGLRDGWKYILDHLDAPVDLQFLKELHQLIAKEDVPWHALGELRTQNVRISGTNYMPEVPNAEKIYADLAEICGAETAAEGRTNAGAATETDANNSDNIGTDTDAAITAMLYIMRTQPFLDGNKRISTLVGNKMLVEKGRGIFSLPPELKEEFSEKLVRFYESGEMDEIKQLIFEKCLTGLD